MIETPNSRQLADSRGGSLSGGTLAESDNIIRCYPVRQNVQMTSRALARSLARRVWRS